MIERHSGGANQVQEQIHCLIFAMRQMRRTHVNLLGEVPLKKRQLICQLRGNVLGAAKECRKFWRETGCKLFTAPQQLNEPNVGELLHENGSGACELL